MIIQKSITSENKQIRDVFFHSTFIYLLFQYCHGSHLWPTVTGFIQLSGLIKPVTNMLRPRIHGKKE